MIFLMSSFPGLLLWLGNYVCGRQMAFSWVDHTPCLCCRICPFCVLVDSGKYFITACAVGMGHNAKNPALMLWSMLLLLGILLLHAYTLWLVLCLVDHIQCWCCPFTAYQFVGWCCACCCVLCSLVEVGVFAIGLLLGLSNLGVWAHRR